MSLSGDELYGDEITSGTYFGPSYLDDDTREALIQALVFSAGYTLAALIQLSDDELLALADAYDVEID